MNFNYRAVWTGGFINKSNEIELGIASIDGNVDFLVVECNIKL